MTLVTQAHTKIAVAMTTSLVKCDVTIFIMLGDSCYHSALLVSPTVVLHLYNTLQRVGCCHNTDLFSHIMNSKTRQAKYS